MSKRTSMKAFIKRAKSEDKKARAVDSFQNLMAGLGIQTDNLSSGATYGFNPVTRQRLMMEWIHRGSWLGGVAVDLVADDMTRAGVTMKGSLKPDQEEAITEEIIRLKLWSRISQTIKWSRLYGGSIGVMLIDGQDPSTPFKIERVTNDQFKGMLVLDRWQVEPSLEEVITELGPDLGLPKYYKINMSARAYRGKKVHHTRCLRLLGVELPDQQAATENMWGISIYERLYDRMVAFDSATQGAAQLVYKAYLRTYSIEGLRTIAAAGGKAEQGMIKYLDMMRRFQSAEGITLLDSKDKFEGHVHQAFSGLGEVLMQFGQQLSGALQIPLVRLFGQSPAGLNSTGESDLRTYYDGILQNQTRDLLIPMTLMYRATAQSLGIKLPKGFGISFKSLWQLTDKERSDVTQTTAEAIKGAYESGLIQKDTALKELRTMSETTGIFSTITDEDIEDAEGEEAPQISQLEPEEGEEEDDDQPQLPPDKKAKKLKETNDRRTRDQATFELAWHYGLYVVIETPKGHMRRGRGWEVEMPADYGYIRTFHGADGDQIDCYVGPDPSSPYVYVIDQLVTPEGSFDEHKVMLGYNTQEEAVSDYVLGHSNGGNLMGAVTAMSMDQFKKWLKEGDLSKPAGEKVLQ
jgi:phage-related protein (TIGR01555 family)